MSEPIDYDDLCKRLRDAEESQPNVGFGQTADALVALRKQLREAESELALADKALAKAEAENAALRDELDELAGQLALTVKELFETEDRTEAAEADNAAIRELMNVYNLGGWTDALAPMKRALAAEADNAALRQDALRYRWLRDTGDATWQPMANREISAKQCDADIDAAIAAKEK